MKKKKIFRLILAGIMIAMSMSSMSMNLNAQDIKCFVKQYKKQDGFTVVTVGKPVMKMIGLFAKAGMEKDEAQIIKCVDAVQILAFDRRCDNVRSETFNSELLTFCDANRYEELIEIVEHDGTVKIFCKTEGETITGLIVLNRSNRDASAEMMSLRGKFTSDDLPLLLDGFGKKIARVN
jgi:hypothetical protein